MAMSVGGSSMGIWKALSDANLRMYQYNMERGRIILAGAAAQEMQRELTRIDNVYNGKKEAEYEAQINAAYEKKQALATTSASLKNALKDIDDIRLALSEMSSAAVSGKSELFDEKLKELNILVGSSTGSEENLSNLVGNRSRGSWSDRVEIFTANGIDVPLKSQFLGTDYQIVLDDGRTISLDSSNKSVGSYKFDGLEMTAVTDPNNGPNLVNGSKVEFTYTYKDEDGVEQTENYAGTLKMGGLQIGNSWLYGLEDTSLLSRSVSTLENELKVLKDDETGNADLIVGKTTELDAAKDLRTNAEIQNKTNGKILAGIVKQAMKTLDKAAREYEFANDMVTSTINGYDTTMKDLQRKYDDAATATLNARTAARTAATAKAKLSDTKFALSSTTSSVLISGLFSYTNAATEKKSLFDVLKVDQYSAYKNLMGK